MQKLIIAAAVSGTILWVGFAHAAGPDVVRINGDDARTLLGDGTGVVVGIIDSGVDDTHPAIAGNVSGGLPRMVAEANFVTTEPANTGDDVFGHGSAVAGVILSNDATFKGIATDARYVNARVLDSNNGFAGSAQVINGTGFALANGANILNLSLGFFGGDTSGNSSLALMCDYISSTLRVPVVVAAGNDGNSANPRPRGPGDAFNVFSVGATAANTYDQIVGFSSHGPTTDGRIKPDISAPGQNINTLNDDWETGSDFETWSGTSFAAPNVTGLLAAQMDYGFTHGHSTDPLVLKATLLNSAEKVNDRGNNAWEPRTTVINGGVTSYTSPLDDNSGAGQIDGEALFHQYKSGDVGSGTVPAVGWDFSSLQPLDEIIYNLGTLLGGSDLVATLTWYRHVSWIDTDNNNAINAGDVFTQDYSLSDLDLSVYFNGTLLAESVSSVDNVEHLYLQNIAEGNYEIRVTGHALVAEDYAIAWRGIAVPEPAALGLLAGFSLLATRRR